MLYFTERRVSSGYNNLLSNKSVKNLWYMLILFLVVTFRISEKVKKIIRKNDVKLTRIAQY